MKGKNHVIFTFFAMLVIGYVLNYPVVKEICVTGMSFECFRYSALVIWERVLKNPVMYIIMAIVVLDMAKAPDIDIGYSHKDFDKRSLSFFGSIAGWIWGAFSTNKKHRGSYHTVQAGLFTSLMTSLLIVGGMWMVGYMMPELSSGLMKYVTIESFMWIFVTGFMSFLFHLLEDSLTVTGVDFLGNGKVLRGRLRTGVNDGWAVVMLLLLEFLAITVACEMGLSVLVMDSLMILGIIAVFLVFWRFEK